LLWAAAIAQQAPGVFPAMQRKTASAETIARGKAVFGINCVACHGADARGGQLNGPNLLRSQLVLADQNGELIAPVIRSGRPERGMPALPLSPDDVAAVVEFIHSLTAASPGQGAPPLSEKPAPDIVVGDAAAGRSYFAAKCAACHAADGDLQGVATRAGDAKTLQNLWVSGGTTGRRGQPSGPPDALATIALPGGQTIRGHLAFIDDFEIKVKLEDGTVRSVRRDAGSPHVEIQDPLEGHKTLLSALTDKDMRNVTAYLVTLK
jgi:cytochrome c oxidase cbb3-type subunit 3